MKTEFPFFFIVSFFSNQCFPMFRSFSAFRQHFSQRFFEKKTTFFFTNSKAGRSRLQLRQSLQSIKLLLSRTIPRNFPHIKKRPPVCFVPGDPLTLIWGQSRIHTIPPFPSLMIFSSVC